MNYYLFSELTLEGITPRRGGLCIIIFYSIPQLMMSALEVKHKLKANVSALTARNRMSSRDGCWRQ